MHGILAVFAPSGQAGTQPLFVLIIQFAAIGGILYFLLIRPQRQQQKKHQDLLASLQKGDQVVTTGGIIGEVIFMKENEVTIKSAESRLLVARSNITAVLNRDAEGAGAKKS
ncbi:MAG TPA: preprotein translocase subunit YajC [Gemmatimonadales bacterium]|jgi:preprotein translocase subunit YajC|nr:preprotein translocase subunit YajC [Gemmatimonadales bacterium]HEX4634521.1 preprotein translocase subunit YajC [Gemmatimonadales bacterium]